MHSVVVLAALTLAAGCASAAAPIPAPGETPSSWAPLAVHTGTLDGDDPEMAALWPGTLVMTSDCVFIEDHGNRSLVVFRLSPDEWTWDPVARELVLPDESLRVGDGDRVSLGGGGRSGDYGPSLEEILGNYTWLNPPDPTCLTQVVFFANGEVRAP